MNSTLITLRITTLMDFAQFYFRREIFIAALLKSVLLPRAHILWEWFYNNGLVHIYIQCFYVFSLVLAPWRGEFPPQIAYLTEKKLQHVAFT